MSQLPTLHDLIPLLPELVLACGAMAMLMLGVAIGERSAAVVNGFSFIVLLLAGAALSSVPLDTHVMFGGSFIVDDYARFLKVLTLVGSGGALLLSLDYLTVENQQKFEYGTLFLLSTLIWVRSVVGWLVLPGIGLALLMVLWRGSARVRDFVIQLLGVQACVSCWRDTAYLFSDGGFVGGQPQRSDTAAIADVLLLPYWFWGGAISVVIVALLAGSLRFALRR